MMFWLPSYCHPAVDGAPCPAQRLNPDGTANGCGIELTKDQVLTWQNQFDSVILSSSQAWERD